MHTDALNGICPSGGKKLRFILAEKHSQGGTDAYKHVGSETCRPSLLRPFQTKNSAEDHGKEKTKADGGKIKFPEIIKYSQKIPPFDNSLIRYLFLSITLFLLTCT